MNNNRDILLFVLPWIFLACTITDTKDENPATLSVIAARPPEVFSSIRFVSGVTDSTLVSIAVQGKNLVVNDKRCIASNLGYALDCNFNIEVRAGKRFVLPIFGNDISAIAVYKRGETQYQISSE